MAEFDDKSEASTPLSFTEPLGLSRRLKAPSIRLDFVPVLDLIVIALLFGLLFTRFVMVPGVSVDLPDSQIQMQPSEGPVAVLTIGNRGMLFFDGSVFELDSVERGFRRHIEARSEAGVVLLVKTEGSMDLQQFLQLCHMAQQAGFVEVQIAAEHLPDGLSPRQGEAGAESALETDFLSVM